MEITKKEIYSLKERQFPEKICFEPIGIVHSPFKTLKGIPIQSLMSKIEGLIEIFPKFKPALKDLEGFSHLFCLYYFDLVKIPVPLQSKPFLKNELKGVFAIRTPFRPNPIGLSILKILEIKEKIIKLANIDILDRTPVLDIKPYVPQFDCIKTKKIGWLKGNIKKKVS